MILFVQMGVTGLQISLFISKISKMWRFAENEYIERFSFYLSCYWLAFDGSTYDLTI